MALAIHRRRRYLLLFRFVDRVAHRAVGHDVAKTPVAVDNRAGWRLLVDVPWRTRHDVAGLDAVDIGGDQDDAVRIMPNQIGADIIARDRRGLVGRGAGSL